MDNVPDIGADDPVGPNLEFDPDFIELERVAQGKPEQQYGSLVVPAEEPDWKATVAGATALLARTYDLRVMAQLAVGRLQLQGLPGFAAGINLIRNVIDTRWPLVHPQLDPEDDNDPTLRANALLRIAEPAAVLRVLRDLPLARSQRAGAVSWRDIAIAAGTIEPDAGKEKIAEASIQAAFRETDAAGLAGLRSNVDTVIADLVAIPAAFDREAGYGTGPDYAELSKLLKEIGRAISKYAPVAEAEAEAGPADEAAASDEAGTGEMETAPRKTANTAVSVAMLGPVTNRADAMRLLELVVQYYEQNEPSSPVPLLIGRAQRLAGKSFFDLLRDMAPDGVQQMEVIAGRPLE